MSYRIDIATTGRAGCQAKRCKDNGVKIQRGELRQGVMVTIREHQSWMYRHWGCVTPAVLHNWWETAEHNLEMIDGFEELPEDAQKKVQTALELQHVDDEDWNGDEDFNRYDPDKPRRGMYAPAPRKKKDAENEEETEPADSPKKQPTKKRSRDEDADEIVKPTKKAKSKVQREPVKSEEEATPTKKTKESQQDNAMADEQPPAKKRQSKSTAKDTSADEKPSNARSKKSKAQELADSVPLKIARAKKGRDKTTEEVEEPKSKRKGRKASS